MDWTAQLSLPALPEGGRRRVAIHGKTSKGFASPAPKALPPVKVFGVQHHVVLCAAGVPEKTNESTILPELIRMIAPVGAIIATDATGCQE